MIGSLQKKAQTFEKLSGFVGGKSLLKYLYQKEGNQAALHEQCSVGFGTSLAYMPTFTLWNYWRDFAP